MSCWLWLVNYIDYSEDDAKLAMVSQSKFSKYMMLFILYDQALFMLLPLWSGLE